MTEIQIDHLYLSPHQTASPNAPFLTVPAIAFSSHYSSNVALNGLTGPSSTIQLHPLNPLSNHMLALQQHNNERFQHWAVFTPPSRPPTASSSLPYCITALLLLHIGHARPLVFKLYSI